MCLFVFVRKRNKILYLDFYNKDGAYEKICVIAYGRQNCGHSVYLLRSKPATGIWCYRGCFHKVNGNQHAGDACFVSWGANMEALRALNLLALEDWQESPVYTFSSGSLVGGDP